MKSKTSNVLHVWPQPPGITKVLLPLKGLAILLVIFAHATITLISTEMYQAPASRLTPILFQVWQISSPLKSVILELCRCAVPIFLFISGYYALMSPRSWKAIWGSSKKILLPLFFWSSIMFALSWRKGAGWLPGEFASKLLQGQAVMGYYYIILQLQFNVLSRWLVPYVSNRPAQSLLIAAIIQLLTQGVSYLKLGELLGVLALPAGSPAPFFFPEYLFPRFILPYTFGIWASTRKDSMKRLMGSKATVWVAIAAFSAVLVLAERGLLFHYAKSRLSWDIAHSTMVSWTEWKLSTTIWAFAATIGIIMLLQRWILFKKMLEWLGKQSFHIFLLHGVVIDFLHNFIYKFMLPYNYAGFIGVVLSVIILITGSLAIAKTIERWAPAPIRALTLGA